MILIGEVVELVGVPLVVGSRKEEFKVVDVEELKFETISGGLSFGLISK